jgi:hypothetical protein
MLHIGPQAGEKASRIDDTVALQTPYQTNTGEDSATTHWSHAAGMIHLKVREVPVHVSILLIYAPKIKNS